MNKFIDIASEVIESSGKIALNFLMPVAGPIINEAFDIPSRLSQKRKQKHLELYVKKLEKIKDLTWYFQEAEENCLVRSSPQN